MLLKEFDKTWHSWDSIRNVSQRNRAILGRHPIVKWVSGKVITVLEKTRGLPRIIRHIDGSKNTQIPAILEDISELKYAPLLLEFFPLLEEIYRIESEWGLWWIDGYWYLLGVERNSDRMNQQEILSLSRVKKIIEGRILYNSTPLSSPRDFVEDYIEDELCSLSPSQIAGVLLVIDLIHKRIPFLTQLHSRYKSDLLSLFAHVKEFKFTEKRPIVDASQQGPFMELSLTREALTALKSKGTWWLFYKNTRNKTLQYAIVLSEDGRPSTQKHERQHHITAWSTPETTQCIRDSTYFNIKDEILAFMAWWDRDFQSIFRTMFTNPLYDLYSYMKDDSYSYNYWREDYRRTLLSGIVCAFLLEKKVGRKNTINILSFLHFRSWRSELRRIFGISIPPALETIISASWKEKDVFQHLKFTENGGW